MGFELRAFLGRHSDLLTWERRLANAIACKLGGELGLVPLTGKLFQELSGDMRRWGAESSKGTVTAYVDMGEFGNQSHETAILWVRGRKALSGVPLAPVLEYLRDRAGIEIGNEPVNLEWHRGEMAADKWEAAERLKRG